MHVDGYDFEFYDESYWGKHDIATGTFITRWKGFTSEVAIKKATNVALLDMPYIRCLKEAAFLCRLLQLAP